LSWSSTGCCSMTSRNCLPSNGSDAKRVEHALDELAGGGDLALVAAAAFGDPLPVGADQGAGAAALTASIAAQRTSRDPCLVIRPPCTVGGSPSRGPGWFAGPRSRRCSAAAPAPGSAPTGSGSPNAAAATRARSPPPASSSSACSTRFASDPFDGKQFLLVIEQRPVLDQLIEIHRPGRATADGSR